MLTIRESLIEASETMLALGGVSSLGEAAASLARAAAMKDVEAAVSALDAKGFNCAGTPAMGCRRFIRELTREELLGSYSALNADQRRLVRAAVKSEREGESRPEGWICYICSRA